MGKIPSVGWAAALCFLVAGVAALFDEDVRYKPSICTRQVKSQCDLGICQREVEIECYHGTCSNRTGECVCSPCWTGDSCDVLENSHMPIFQQQTLVIDVNVKDTYSDDVIATVRAEDPDADKCSHSDSCPCANILYSIEEGNEDSLFMIDPKTGDIGLSGGRQPKDLRGTVVEIKVAARNPVHRTRVRRRGLAGGAAAAVGELGDIAPSTMGIRIAFTSGEKDRRAKAVHSRRRRSASGAPDEETFTLEKLAPFTDATDVKIGQIVPLRLTLWLPIQTTTMTVELLTPYESSAVMVLCDPVFTHVGDNYPSFDSQSVTPIYYAHGNDFRYDRVVLNLGDVTNNGDDPANDVHSKIKIDFSVILQENNATQYGQNYHVSAGVTYGSSLDNVWVGQTILTPVDDTDDWSVSSPVVTISGPSQMTVKSSAVFSVDLLLKNHMTDFYVDVVAEPHEAGNPIMKVCEFQLSGKGDHFACMPDELPRYSSVQDNTTSATILARLDFGKVVNTGLRGNATSNAMNTLSTEAVVYILDSSDIVDGAEYWLGVMVTVAGDKFYSSQYAITTSTTPASTMTDDPVIEFYAVDGYAVTIGGSVGFVVTIDVPVNTTSEYVVDVSMPYTSANGAILSICWAEVVYVGYNIPCLGSMTPEFQLEDGQNVDYLQFDLGGISNLGRRGEADDNKLKVMITAELLADHPDVANGTEFQVRASVRYSMVNKDMMWVSNASITAVDYQHHVYADNDQIPVFKLQNRDNDFFFYNKSAVSFNITVRIPPGTTYSPMLLNISAQLGEADGRPMFGICRVEVVRIGPSFHCHTLAKTQTANVSTAEGVAYGQLVDLGVVTNSLEADMQAEPDDGAIVVEVSLQWIDHPELVDDENVTVTVQSSYGPTGTWKRSMDYIISFSQPEYKEDDDAPQFELTLAPDQSNVLRAGALAVYELAVLTPPGSASTYWMDVVTTNTSLSICRSNMLRAGRNMPCFDTDRPVQYLSFEEDGHRDRAVLDIGPVKNIGSKPIVNADDNKMVVQVVVKIEDAAIPATNWTDPEIQEFEVTVKAGHTQLYTVPKQVIVDVSPAITTLEEIPVLRFTKLNAESLVTIGGSVVFNLDIYVPYGSVSTYKVQFFGDRVDPYRTTVCEARQIASGWNVPCVNGTFLTTVYSSTVDGDHIDLATIDLGAMANMVPSGSHLESELNKVRVQVVARLESNDTVEEGDQVWLSAAVKLNEYNEYYVRASFNATQDNLYSETNAQPQFQIYPPQENVVMTIGSKATYLMKITTPIMSTPMTVNITLPTAGDEAFLTISDIQLLWVGVNYACHNLYEIEPVYNSSHSTSQNDTAIVDLGVLTNHGTTHYYQYNPEYVRPEDDEILLSLEVQLADHPDLFNEAEIQFDVFFDYSLGRQTALNETVTVSILGDERPEIVYNITMPDYDPLVTQQGDLLLTEFSFHHTNTSSSHAYGVVVYIMLPYYLEIDEEIEIKGPPLCVKRSDAGIKFHFAEMFFTDTFSMWFNISMDPNLYMPIQMGQVNTTVPLEVIYYKRDGTDSNGDITLGDVYKTETLVLDLTFLTERCFDVLGIESNSAILDCQIRASSYLSDDFSPQMARLNSESGWAPAIRDMKPYKGNDYLEVRFGGQHRFSGVKMQTGFGTSNAVTSYQLSYSEDGIVWHNYDHTFENDYNGTTSMDLIPAPFNGAYFRIRPQSHAVNTSYPVMRFELYGCKRTVEIDMDEACATTDFPDYPYYERGFIIEPTTGSVFVCILEYIDGPTRCSFSLDNGTTWEEMDDNVANVIALEPETKELFGISQNRRAIMRSGNLGVTWSSMEPERYQALSDSNKLLEVVRVPFAEIDDEPNTDMATDWDGTFFEWGAASYGLYRRQVIVSNGSSEWELMGMWGYP